MPQTKATKKFEKKHLKDTIKRRKEFAKVKQKIQLKEKRKARRAKENGPVDDDDEAGTEGQQAPNGNKFADMSVDEFFAGGFEIPEQAKKSKKSKADHKLGKRKRTATEDGDDNDDEDIEETLLDGQSDDNDSVDESGDEFEDHKQQLEALAEKDPAFYKHLKENDPELLDFADDADLAGIQLSDSEEETPKSKKQKTGKKKQDNEDVFGEEVHNEVTMAMVEKWHTLMTEKHSLTQTREVVLAFRAAVRSNEAEEREFKYSISNPSGKQMSKSYHSSAKSSNSLPSASHYGIERYPISIRSSSTHQGNGFRKTTGSNRIREALKDSTNPKDACDIHSTTLSHPLG